MNSDLAPIFLKLPPQKIVYLKFILESYEGLGELRTLNSNSGEVVILAIRETKENLDQLLNSLKQELSLCQILPPYSMKGDWLLSEELQTS